jgi:hypothetical protein
MKLTAAATTALLAPGNVRAGKDSTMTPNDAAKATVGPKLNPFMPRKHTISHLGCIHACADRLGVKVETAWLYGVTGYAFLLNIFKGVMCAGPTAWDWQRIAERTPDLGIDTSSFIRANKKDADFAQKKEQAIAFTKTNYDACLPLYGAEFGFPEFYTIAGYSDAGFYLNSWCFKEETQLRTWEEFGLKDVGALIVGAVKKSSSKPDDMKAIAGSLTFALSVGHAEPGYLGGSAVGLRGYDKWVESLHDGSLSEGPWNHPDGTTHNAECWLDCRLRAVEFLQMAAKKTKRDVSRQLVAASEQYGKVVEALKGVRAIFHYNMGPKLPSEEQLAEATKHLRAAKEAESKGLDLLAVVPKML